MAEPISTISTVLTVIQAIGQLFGKGGSTKQSLAQVLAVSPLVGEGMRIASPMSSSNVSTKEPNVLGKIGNLAGKANTVLGIGQTGANLLGSGAKSGTSYLPLSSSKKLGEAATSIGIKPFDMDMGYLGYKYGGGYL